MNTSHVTALMCKLLILRHSIFSKNYPIKVKISFSVFLILSGFCVSENARKGKAFMENMENFAEIIKTQRDSWRIFLIRKETQKRSISRLIMIQHEHFLDPHLPYIVQDGLDLAKHHFSLLSL
jgi:hypothetical protein